MKAIRKQKALRTKESMKKVSLIHEEKEGGEIKMACIRVEELRGYWIGEELVCPKCILPEEVADLGLDDLLTSDEMDEEVFYFCDREGERIWK